jgi:hypothetical protein
MNSPVEDKNILKKVYEIFLNVYPDYTKIPKFLTPTDDEIKMIISNINTNLFVNKIVFERNKDIIYTIIASQLNFYSNLDEKIKSDIKEQLRIDQDLPTFVDIDFNYKNNYINKFYYHLITKDIKYGDKKPHYCVEYYNKKTNFRIVYYLIIYIFNYFKLQININKKKVFNNSIPEYEYVKTQKENELSIILNFNFNAKIKDFLDIKFLPEYHDEHSLAYKYITLSEFVKYGYKIHIGNFEFWIYKNRKLITIPKLDRKLLIYYKFLSNTEYGESIKAIMCTLECLLDDPESKNIYADLDHISVQSIIGIIDSFNMKYNKLILLNDYYIICDKLNNPCEIFCYYFWKQIKQNGLGHLFALFIIFNIANNIIFIFLVNI